ncbi:ECF transporter S component [Caldisalinibacter kiritimatiensis]|uniref:Substrate-specific component of predicted B12-regulated ECF transporter for dimethylbenzimidazole n=1 Tax=Caldisalinibacter kiritimatiensis TaxID=1304284 RepID=R1CDM2_9FIRM|nr:ECF transporter S component [Caldisalinibacter kiritimatiensis]EOD00390.1 Substrate-specific component of predicted B12-regulated ECF transporter for dimethylbenzimidazole [Caldisalinibacter kiritimatiensis]
MNSNVLNVKSSTLKLTYSAMLIGLSFIGSLIKVQGSIAFDSMPGYFAALLLGPVYGGIVAGIGHLLTALTSGFPLTLPMHLIVGLEMASFGFVFGWMYRKINTYIAAIVAIILNGAVAALIAIPISQILGLPLSGWSLFYAIIAPLTITSTANVVLAFLVYGFLKKRFN